MDDSVAGPVAVSDAAAPWSAVVDASLAETLRRALDQAGLLDTTRKLTRTEGQLALPLACGAETARARWPAGQPVAELVQLNAAEERGVRSRMLARAEKALVDSGVPTTAARVLVQSVPRRWEKVGEVVLFQRVGVFDEADAAGALLPGGTITPEQRAALWEALATALGAARLGVQGRIEDTLHRNSGATLLWPVGATGWTVHREQGLVYGLDVTRSMFSSGNGTEKMRVGRFACAGQTVVDLYAGIGYFSVPYLARAGAERLHACEWDDDALRALRHNLAANGVAERAVVHAGDNANALPHFEGTADRVNLGLIPSSEAGWPLAVRALKPAGGTLHVHANVSSEPGAEAAFGAAMLASLDRLAVAAGRQWELRLDHIERVKWYAPKLRHCVLDVSCVPMHSAALSSGSVSRAPL